MKVKIIASYNASVFEMMINEFIKDKHVLDIQYQSVRYRNHTNGDMISDRAVIVYEEGDEDGQSGSNNNHT